MALNTFLDFSTTAASNVDVAGIGIQGANAVSNFDNAFRELIAILRRDLDNGIVLTSKSANYTAVANDNNALIRFSAAATLTLTAAATLGADWHCWVAANGGDVVIDPNSSETIDGRTTLTVRDGSCVLVICDGTNFRTDLQADQRVPRGHLSGLTLSNNASDATNDIDIATGEAGSDGTTPYLMVLGSALTKRLDAAWTVGSGNGGLDTGSIANTTYHVWLIQRSDTGVVDALFSASATSPTMPTNYDRKRRIGSIIRSAGAIVTFQQVGDVFNRTPVVDRSNTAAAASALLALSIPEGVVVAPLVRCQLNIEASEIASISLGSAGMGSANVAVISPGTGAGDSADIAVATPPPVFFSNTSRQIYFAQTNDTGTPSVSTLTTYGWVDTRGRA